MCGSRARLRFAGRSRSRASGSFRFWFGFGHGILWSCATSSAAPPQPRPGAALDQAMAVEDRVDGAFGRNADIAVEPSDQQLADLARAPVRFLGLEADDQALDLLP